MVLNAISLSPWTGIQSFFEQEQAEGTILEGPEAYQGVATYLNHHLPTFLTADCGSFEGCDYFDPPNPNVPPFDPERVEAINWTDEEVDIETEVGLGTQGRRSIHAFIQDRLLNSGAHIVLYDHGTGELADFVTLERRPEDVLVSLFHCKGSSGPNAGERVEDLYEVCGQAIKSARWVDRKLMIDGLNRRVARGSNFLRGSLGEFLGLLKSDLPVSLQIVLVQPGLSKAEVRTRAGPLLAAVDDFIRGGRCHRLKVIASD